MLVLDTDHLTEFDLAGCGGLAQSGAPDPRPYFRTAAERCAAQKSAPERTTMIVVDTNVISYLLIPGDKTRLRKPKQPPAKMNGARRSFGALNFEVS